MSRPSRALLLVALAAVCLAAPATDAVAYKQKPAQASARQARLDYPRAPAAGYRPRQVNQNYNNCAFASAEMLIDKWTRGRRSAPQHALRRATGISPQEGGPTLGELRRAVARVAGIDMRWSPHGGDAMTWQELLGRLERGGGALVNLWPARLPRHYRRWLPALTAGHSVYVERYQSDRHRVWLMDPLGRGRGFGGEWIDADVLRSAVWRSGGYVWAAATPKPPREPNLAEFDLGSPKVAAIGFSDDQLDVSIRYTPRLADALLPELRLFARWEPVPDEEPVEPPTRELPDDPAVASDRTEEANAAALAARLPTDVEPVDDMAAAAVVAADTPAAELTTEVSLPEPSTAERAAPFQSLSDALSKAGGQLRAVLPTPAVPGGYRLTLELRGADGSPLESGAPTFDTTAVELRGPLAGTAALAKKVPETAARGEVVSLVIEATNLGSEAWSASDFSVSLAVSWDGGPAAVVRPVALQSGRTRAVPFGLFVGAAEGRRTVRLTLVDAAGAPLPESAPIDLVFDVIPADPRLAEIY